MATIPANQIAHLFNRPGYWMYVIDDEDAYREQFGDKDQKPDFTPEGHWQWIPSPMESLREAANRFAAHWHSLSEEQREKVRRENEAVLSKGFQIPHYFRKPLDPE